MNDQRPTQLTLGVQLRDDANFENFYVNQANEALFAALTKEALDSHLVYLWGSANSGRSHVLQATCYQRAQAGLGVLYLPLQDIDHFDPDMLQGTDSLSIVCLDDLESIAGNAQWEQAVFNLYNTLQESDTSLLVSASCAPLDLQVELADLHSRLQSGLTFQLTDMSDADKCAMLSLRAANRGMDLNLQVADYIVKRVDRNVDQLIKVLDRLDGESLQLGRRLTIPLVREVMRW